MPWGIIQFLATGMVWQMILSGFVREFMGPTLRRAVNSVGSSYLLLGSDGQLPGVLWVILMLSELLVRDWGALDSAPPCTRFLIGLTLII